jgi:dihydroorotase
MTMVLRGGRILDPSQELDTVGDVVIVDGKVSAVTDVGAGAADTEINVQGHLVTPGLVDIHVHLREPGFEYKEDIESGTLAAAAGGFTSVCCMPNTDPAIDTPAVVRQIIERSEAVGSARVYPIASMTRAMAGDRLSDIAELKAAGACAISDDAFPVQNSETMRRGMEYCAQFGLTVMTHNEDQTLTVGGAMNEGLTATTMGVTGIPRVSEDIGAVRNILLSRLTGCRLHLLHMSTAVTVELLRWAKRAGIPVTGETGPHYVTLTDRACMGYDTHAKMNPPLRTDDDIAGLKAGLADDTIDVIATDHAPHARHEKEREFDRAPFGILGLETAFGLVYSRLVLEGVLSLTQAVAKMTVAPARALGLPVGTLAPGAPADVAVFDLDAPWQVEPDRLRSKSRNTPFAGWELRGRPVLTIVGGRVVRP